MRKFISFLLVIALLGMSGLSAAAAGEPDDEEELLPFFGDSDGNRLADDLDARLAAAGETEEIPVVVMLDTLPDERVMTQLRDAAGDFIVRAEWELAVMGFATDLTPAQIDALATDPIVTRIDLDREVHAFMNTATTWTGVGAARTLWGVCGDRDGNPTSYSSTDVVIAVLDTGIHIGHVDLDGGKVIGWKDYIKNQTTPYDDHGHGTHCAGIAAGTGEGDPAYTGVAPGAALVGIKILNKYGRGTTSGIINGINWMISNKSTYGIRIGSMSLGSSGSSDGTDSLSVAVNNAVGNGIIMCVAAGNSGPARYTIGSPAAAISAITVGALYDPGEKGWVLAEFSSRGPTADGRTKPDICAPGRYITSCSRSTSGYTTMSGTSMACPFIAGVIALMLDADYSLTDSGVKNILYTSGNVKDFGPPGKDIDFGYGINLSYNAIKQAGDFESLKAWADGLSMSYDSGSLSGAGDYIDYYFTVTSTPHPIGITLVIPNHSWFVDFDLRLYNPSGTLVAWSLGTKRQEQILYQPTVTGTYRLRVDSYRGSGTFWFNKSWR